MTQNKSTKRKRNSKAQQAQKLAKVDPIVTLDETEPKSLQTVISEEELDITTETLSTLAEYPKLIKSKQCKSLRAAAFDFRRSCSAGDSLGARVTDAINDGKYLDARILLAEMRIRGEEPKLGALCRWVRELDVVSKPNGKRLGNTDRSFQERELELLVLLDAVMRVGCPLDMKAPLPLDPASHISFQPSWDLRSSSTPDQVYTSVLDKSIFTHGREAVASCLRVIETTPGYLRKPPNHHAAILYSSDPNAIPLAAGHDSTTYHTHPNVPNLSLIKDVLTQDECKAIIATGEAVKFLPDEPIRDRGDTSVLAHNFYWIVDTAFHDALWARVSAFIPRAVNGKLARGLNRRFRVYRYVPGAEYRCHIDGAWPPSGISADGRYLYDNSPAGRKQSSLFTFLVYLNDEFEGGETMFFLPSPLEGTLNAYPVRPVMGAVALFPHGEAKGALLHEGTSVTKGAKYIIRTDVEYDVEPWTE